MRTNTIIVSLAAGCVALMTLMLVRHWRSSTPAADQKHKGIYGTVLTPEANSNAADLEKTIAGLRSTTTSREQRMPTKIAISQAISDDANLESAVRLLISDEKDVREAGGAILAAIGTEDAVTELIDAIKREGDSGVRNNLLECVRGITNAAAVPALARQAMDLSDLSLHRFCRNALSAIRDPTAVATMIQLIEQAGPDIPEPLAYALSHTVSQEALAILQEGCSSENDIVAQSCIQALRNLDTAESCRALIEVITGEISDVRRQYAIIALNEMALESKDARLVNVLSGMLESEAGTQIVRVVVDALALISDPSAGIALRSERDKRRDAEMHAYINEALSRWQKRFRN